MASEPNKLKFPDGFMWGTATASYQIEGASTEDREPTIWDEFSETPGNVLNGDTGAVACDHYHRYRNDVIELLKPLNVSHYRFSICWSRILKTSINDNDDDDDDDENIAGISFYNALIDTLLEHNIQPVVTLYHWDLPISIAKRHGSNGWHGSKTIVNSFVTYARTCFKHFGDRVKLWITLNEPFCSAFVANECGDHAPGNEKKCSNVKSGISVYKTAHHLLLAHAKAVQIYRQEFQDEQKGKIGITLNSMWFQPKNETNQQCIDAAKRAIEFELGWFAHPIYFGNYPKCMRESIDNDRLPQFTKEESEMLKDSSDFFGLNHYSTIYVTGMYKTDATLDDEVPPSYEKDRGVCFENDPSWDTTDMGWAIVPDGLRKLLEYIQRTYKPKGGIIITENGLAAKEDKVESALSEENGEKRIQFYKDYIHGVYKAIVGDEKVDVRGYFLWSLMDNFEWAFGYSKRFGLYYVDYETQQRTPKPAVKWYTKLITENALLI